MAIIAPSLPSLQTERLNNLSLVIQRGSGRTRFHPSPTQRTVKGQSLQGHCFFHPSSQAGDSLSLPPGTQITAPCHRMPIFSPSPTNCSPISCIQHAFRKTGALQGTGDRKLGENHASLRSPGAGYPTQRQLLTQTLLITSSELHLQTSPSLWAPVSSAGLLVSQGRELCLIFLCLPYNSAYRLSLNSF